jgi:hypothetical protein
MAVNLLEEDRLVYHDEDGSTLEFTTFPPANHNSRLFTLCECGLIIKWNRGAVETLRDALTCWLETGRLTTPTPNPTTTPSE